MKNEHVFLALWATFINYLQIDLTFDLTGIFLAEERNKTGSESILKYRKNYFCFFVYNGLVSLY